MSMILSCWWLLTTATAAPPLAVTVHVEDPMPGPRPSLRPRAAPLPWARGEVAVDGELDEPAWTEASPAPPLGPYMTGRTPPAVDLRVLMGREGLALGLAGLPDGQRAEITVDPSGTGAAWWKVVWGRERVEVSTCRPPDDLRPDAVFPPGAVPCTPTDAALVAHGTDFEALLPHDVLGTPTCAARTLLRLVGPPGTGGTWAPWGRTDDHPTRGRLLDACPRGSLGVRFETDGTWVVDLSLPDGQDLGQWTWARAAGVEVIDRGDASSHFTLPPVEAPRATLVAVGPEPHPRPAAAAAVRPRALRVWLRTPVPSPVLELGFDSPSPAEDLLLEATTPGGRVVAWALVDLPAGTGVVAVVPPRRRPLLWTMPGLPEPIRVRPDRSR